MDWLAPGRQRRPAVFFQGLVPDDSRAEREHAASVAVAEQLPEPEPRWEAQLWEQLRAESLPAGRPAWVWVALVFPARVTTAPVAHGQARFAYVPAHARWRCL